MMRPRLILLAASFVCSTSAAWAPNSFLAIGSGPKGKGMSIFSISDPTCTAAVATDLGALGGGGSQDGYFMDSVTAVDAATNTYYVGLASSISAGQLLAVNATTGAVLRSSPTGSATIEWMGLQFDPVESLLYGVDGTDDPTTIYRIDTQTLEKVAAVGALPSQWIPLSTHGQAFDYHHGIYYVMAANMYNATIGYSVVFGVDITSGKIVSQGKIPYGGPQITFSLYFDGKTDRFLGIAQHNEKTSGYFIVEFDPVTATWVKPVAASGGGTIFGNMNAYPSVNAFSSAPGIRSYIVEFSMMATSPQITNLVTFDIDSGLVTGNVHNWTHLFVDMAVVPAPKQQQQQQQQQQQHQRHRDPTLVLANTVTAPKDSPGALNYAVESRIYPEAPGLLWVTMRGGGISVYQIDADPIAPKLISRWGNGEHVEGQDRRGDVLVVTDEGRSGLFVFDASVVSAGAPLAPLARIDLSLAGALHVKLYHHAASGRTFAIISNGLGHAKGTGNYITAVDVTNPRAPVEVATLETPVKCTEGVLVVGAFAFVGGYCSNSFASVALDGLAATPPSMAVVSTVTKPYYDNMVSAVFNASYESLRGEYNPSPVFFAGLYTSPGGVAVFSAGDDAATHGTINERAALVLPKTARTNRVHVHEKSHIALLALEKGGASPTANATARGGLALVDVRNASAPALLQALPIPDAVSRCYCGAIHPGGRHAYVFGATSQALYVYNISLPWG